VFLISLTILIVILGAQVFLRFFANGLQNTSLPLANPRSVYFLRICEYIFVISIILIFILLIFQSYQQYQLWLKNDISKYLLPPYSGIDYFVFYTFNKFFAPYLMSLIAAVLFLFSAKIINKKYEERFFYPEGYYLGALGIFLSSHPGWLFYLFFLIFVYLLIHLYSLFIIHNSFYRISLYWLWIPTAIFVIIMNNIFLAHLSWWKILTI